MRPRFASRVGAGGSTLLELVVSASLLLVIFGLTLAIFRTGASSWAKVEARSEQLQQIQVLQQKLRSHLGATQPTGISLSAGQDAIAIASPLRPDNTVSFDSVAEELQWERFFIYYYDGSAVRYTSIDNPAPSLTAEPLDVHFPDWQTTQTGSGNLLVENVISFQLEPVSQRLLAVTVVCERQRYGSPKPERVAVRSTLRIHN